MYGITVEGRKSMNTEKPGALPVWGIAAGLVLALSMPAAPAWRAPER